ncbi:MAG TPA: hypothetical protein VJ011_03685 [Steroidobacteraceae bacterium]|nr:hypothetical protein [Steroidobacteraceae bacterium]
MPKPIDPNRPIPFWPTLAASVALGARDRAEQRWRELFASAIERGLQALERADWGGAEMWLTAAKHAATDVRP